MRQKEPTKALVSIRKRDYSEKAYGSLQLNDLKKFYAADVAKVIHTHIVTN